ncbi:hypothetical protein B0H66DRAFT_1439 [Apodospora peruviana]|uniref:RGS domain-containing protein n=1 Tax=Apodospora peruviana TaxID=516989 RepID=A0AAE0IPE4_9PEZI|nr:hypothetical protein B0H66DRAFT_1439 [Apodospora peruviana]
MILPHNAISPRIEGSEFGTRPDTAPEARFDAIGIWWFTFGGVWTVLLISGMVFLYRKRDTPTLRIRGLPLTFAGIVLLHLYFLTVQTGYTIGLLLPEVAEFWIMSLWYPFGIALFQAGNSQFLHIAKAQSRFARPPSQMKTRYDEKRTPKKKSTFLGRIRAMDYSKRMFTFVTAGMVMQLIVVVVIFMISRKFHPSFGIPGTEVTGTTPQEIFVQQGRGWEWWPSLFWQFLWAWVIAPVILWQSRGIHDTHGWQLQTIACCIAGLPAAPMWLIALYVPAMAPVNSVFIPPQWIALSIFVIEIFTVLVPCFHVRRQQTLRQETLDLLAQWESKKKNMTGFNNKRTSKRESFFSSGSTKLQVPDSPISGSNQKDPWKKLPSFSGSSQTDTEKGLPEEGVLTMSALEHVLSKNPEPLRQFSAKRDFSGENIGFLTAVSEWKSGLPPPFLRNRYNAAPDVVREEFTKALRIYTEFVGVRDAEFPINISGAELRKLEGTFERAARSMYGDRNRVDFAEVDWSAGPKTESEMKPGTAVSTETLVMTTQAVTGMLYEGEIPTGFDAAVFDEAQADIKYLVLTNTWPKYVREKRDPEGSIETATAASTQGTSRSKASLKRALGFLKSIIT